MASTETEQVEFGILGALEVRMGGRPVPMRQGLTRAVLLSLLLRPNQTVSTDVLIEDLYGEDLPAHPLNALQVQVSYLRKVLADAGAADLLRTEGAGYRLVVEPTAVDAGQLRDPRQPGPTAQPMTADLRDSVRAARGSRPGARAVAGHAARGCGLPGLRRWPRSPGWTSSGSCARELRAEVQLALGHHREIVPDLAALAEEQPHAGACARAADARAVPGR